MFVVTGLRILTLKLLLTAIIVHGSFQINTCCPKGYKFKDYSLGLFKSSQFVCEEVGEDYDSNQDVLEGYSIKQSDKIMIPTCDDPFVVKITSEISLSRSSCIVKLDSEYYAVTCAARESTKLNLIQKCCPAGHSYDGDNRECVPSDVSTDVFYMLFKNPVIFQSESFTCSESKVIIEYIWDYHKFKLEDSSLVVSNVDKYFDSDSYCLDTVIPGNESRISNKNGSDAVVRRINFMARTCNSPLVCNSIPCIRKCCKDNEKLVEIDQKTTCVHHQNDHSFVFHKFVRNDSNNVVEADLVQPKEFGILRGQNCAKYKLEPDDYPEDIHYINHEDGSLYIPSIPDTYDHSKYCVEFFQGEDYEDNEEEEDQEIKAYTFVCFEDQKTDTVRFILYPVGLIVSSAFCIVTLIVYLFVPKLRNLPGKILVCLVFCLLGCYTALAIGQLFPTDGLGCYPLALFLYFSFMGAFTWTNIMCIDIWLTFSSARNHHSIRKRREKRKILIYMIYGWSIPSLLTLMIVGLDKWQEVPKDFRPRFGGTRCWFEYLNLIPHLLYFIFPAGTLVFINVVLFVLTLRYINKVKREICRMQSSNAEKPLLRRRFGVDKARFAMNIKIFIVMGVSWAVEIVSTLVYDRKNLYFWFLTDFFNTLQGVFVFFIFVFKWKVWYAILDRFGIKHKKRYKPPPTSNLLRLKSMESCSSLLNSNVTNVTNVSRRTRETDRSDAE